jgi:hypothetical protein
MALINIINSPVPESLNCREDPLLPSIKTPILTTDQTVTKNVIIYTLYSSAPPGWIKKLPNHCCLNPQLFLPFDPTAIFAV